MSLKWMAPVDITTLNVAIMSAIMSPNEITIATCVNVIFKNMAYHG